MSGNTNEWHWHRAHELPIPLCGSMVCACRISKKLFKIICSYTIKLHHGIFHEIFFNTLANHNNLKISTPLELSGIVYRYEWTIDDILKNPSYLNGLIFNLSGQNLIAM